MTDAVILSQLRKGDSRALNAIIAQYGPYVQTIAANITIPPLQPEDVEEVASDVFLSLWNSADTIEAGKLKAWLAAVTRNTAKNKLRSQHLALPLEDDYFILDVPDVEDDLFVRPIKAKRVKKNTSAVCRYYGNKQYGETERVNRKRQSIFQGSGNGRSRQGI